MAHPNQPPLGPITLRQATDGDRPAMMACFSSAFSNSQVDKHVFPRSDPASMASHVEMMDNYMSDPLNPLVVAIHHTDQGEQIIGWVRWVRKPQGIPSRPIMNPSDYPASGNRDFGVAFFQAASDAPFDHLGATPHWHLSTLVVDARVQRRGVGTMLVRHGIVKADEDGWPVFVNASKEGKGLYERFGFREVGERRWEVQEVVLCHMLRPAKEGGRTEE